MSMKHAGQIIGSIALVLAMTGAGGCGLLVVGAAAGAGTVAYVGNELRVTRDVGLDHAWEAANAAMKDMEITVIPSETRKDKMGGIVQGRNANDQLVRIELTRRSEKTTEIRMRVGLFETPENRSATQLLYDTMNKHL